jgi:hypothetical protein
MRIAVPMLRPASVERPILARVGYRFALYTLLALALCGCDLLTGARSSASPSGQLGIPTTAATVAPTATPSSFLSLPPASPSALASTLASLVPSPSLPPVLPSFTVTLPPVFTPTIPPTLVPTPTIAPPTIAPTPSPTAARATITSFAPEFGFRGALVFISGTGLASTRLVLFGDVAVAPSTPATETQVTAIVPQAAVTSRISVVTLAGVTTSTRFFTVLEPEPVPSPTCPIRVNCLPTPPPSPSSTTTP